MNSVSDDLSLLCRNAVDVIDKRELESRLAESAKKKKPLRIKAGFDPSAPDIHLGHAVLLRKLREFQDLGHKVVFIIGDYTALIGDPTGQTKTRPALSKEEAEKNARTYQAQAFKILDQNRKKIEIVKNSGWLSKISLQQFLAEIAPRFTVARVLERDDFEKRMAENQPISFREFVYPLLQAYDSVRVRADVELGGTDQKFNLLAGRDLQRAFGQRPQIVMTFPLLVGLDGTQKMSKSLGNTVSVTENPKDMFGKLMSIPDTLMPAYFDLLTGERSGPIEQDIQSGKLHPKEAKKRLALSIVGFYFGQRKAEEEAREFERVFSHKQNPEKAAELVIEKSEIPIADLLKQTLVVTTTNGAVRMVEQGGVSLDGKKITNPKEIVSPKADSILKVGKKAFFRIVRRCEL